MNKKRQATRQYLFEMYLKKKSMLNDVIFAILLRFQRSLLNPVQMNGLVHWHELFTESDYYSYFLIKFGTLPSGLALVVCGSR